MNERLYHVICVAPWTQLDLTGDGTTENTRQTEDGTKTK